jgi:CRISPR-associated protein Csm4
MRVQVWSVQGGSFHFGRHGLGQEKTNVCFPSDSLFAALLARQAARDEAALEAFVQPFEGESPPFVLTSTFPFAGKVRFFPNPLAALRQTGDQPEPSKGAAQSLGQAKDIKKIRYVSEAVFRELLKGRSLVDLVAAGSLLQNKQALVSQDELPGLPQEERKPIEKIWDIQQRPRVTLGRGAPNSAIFFTGQVSYAPGCGLWIGLRWLEQAPQLERTLLDLIADLAEAGLGAVRNAGLGACTIQPGGEIDLPDAQGRPWVTLSRYLPRSDEMSALTAPGAAYSLLNVGGWLQSAHSSGQRRRSANLLAEGSVFGPLPRRVPGQVVDLRPRYSTDNDPLKHPVYRSGLAFAVGLQGGQA